MTFLQARAEPATPQFGIGISFKPRAPCVRCTLAVDATGYPVGRVQNEEVPARPMLEQIRERVQRAFEPVPEVRAALVFGSYARRRARPDSDIDVAVLLDPSARAGDRGELLRKLLAALGRELRSDRIDLVVLDDARPALAFQVLRHGDVALDRDRVTLHRFRVRTYALHSDYEPIERFFRRATKRRAMGQTQRVGNGRR